MQIKPLHNNILIKPIISNEEQKTTGGIIIPPTVNLNKRSIMAEVVAVGPGKVKNGVRTIIDIKPGDIVHLSKFAGTRVIVENVSYYIIDISEILGVEDD